MIPPSCRLKMNQWINLVNEKESNNTCIHGYASCLHIFMCMLCVFMCTLHVHKFLQQLIVDEWEERTHLFKPSLRWLAFLCLHIHFYKYMALANTSWHDMPQDMATCHTSLPFSKSLKSWAVPGNIFLHPWWDVKPIEIKEAKNLLLTNMVIDCPCIEKSVTNQGLLRNGMWIPKNNLGEEPCKDGPSKLT